MKVVTRFPPSPTGFFHIGSARTALFNCLFTAKEKGIMYLRFEDTDVVRTKKEYEEDIVEGLKWLGISYSLPASPRQSERRSIYQKHLQRLLDTGAAYEAEAATGDASKKVVRFRNPNTTITFNDLVRGDVTFKTAELEDFVIGRSIDEPLYHLAVVIDDHEMGVTHVIRGEDHISNTPRQILILEALGFQRPIYAHIPLILASDRSKLSKRHGAVSVNEYKSEGYLPEALVNYLALLGWNPGDDREVLSMKELIDAFSIERVHKSGAIFDKEKLLWFNHQYLKKLPHGEYTLLLQSHGIKTNDLPIDLIKERARTISEVRELIAEGEFRFLSSEITYAPELLIKGAKSDTAAVKMNLSDVLKMLEGLNESEFGADQIKEVIFPYATAKGRAAVLWPLRVALTGQEKSPDPFTIASLLGKDKTLSRVKKAIEKLQKI